MTPHRILILGGTTEARLLAGRLADRSELAVTLSLAGRTVAPAEQPVPTRTGGFGGIEGLAGHLRRERVGLLVDATHPYAARISANAAAAADVTEVPLLALRRPVWEPVTGDRWVLVDDSAGAIAALGSAPRTVFLALGRQELAPFETAPQHRYVVRSVEPITPPLAVPHAIYIRDRGPFEEADEYRLLKRHGIDLIVSKNSGGQATYGKIAAARSLGIDVVMFRRPEKPGGHTVTDVGEAVAAIDHWFASARARGE